MAKTIVELRKTFLEEYDRFIRNISDENAWLEWIECGLPDGYDDEDLEFFANDEEEWKEITKLFYEISVKYQ